MAVITVGNFPTTATTITVPKEYAWDFTMNDYLLVDGKFKIVEGTEALKVWIWKALKTPNGIYAAYSNNYGQTLDTLIGKSYSPNLVTSEAQRIVWECISYNQHITGISNFTADATKDILTVSFTAQTDQGEVVINGV